MAVRIYVCPTVGTGTGDDPYRALGQDIREPGTRWWAAILTEPEGPGRGRPRFGWCLFRNDATDFTALDASSDCFHLTAEVLDGAIRNPVRVQLRNRGVMTNDEFDGLTTNRDLVRYLLAKQGEHGWV